MTVRATGEGNLGDQGQPGHLFVKVKVKPSDVFRREGANLYVDVPITLQQAVLGGTVSVPTVDGLADLTVTRARAPARGAVVRPSAPC